MGYAEIVKANGEVITIENDQIVKYNFDYCDKCNNFVLADNGSYQLGIAGEKLAWFCEACK